MAAKLGNDASIATITTIPDADFILVVDDSTGELSKITAANAKIDFDSGGGSAALTYVALLTQSATGAPVATVILNTLGVTITYSRTTTGEYEATASGAVFTSNKTAVFITNGSPANGIAAFRFSSTVILIQSGTFSTPADTAIFNASFKIEVYP